MNCSVCHRPLTTKKAIQNGMGDICAQKLKNGDAPTKPKIHFLGKHPDESRSWSVSGVMVRIYPLGGVEREAFCYCAQYLDTGEKCEHIALVAEVDREMFQTV